MHETLLQRIDAANTDLPDRRRIHSGLAPAHAAVSLRRPKPHRRTPPACRGCYRWRKIARVEIGVRVEPEHAQFLAAIATVARHRADRADAEAMIAAEQNRQVTIVQRCIHCIVDQLVPCGNLGQMPIALGVAPATGCRGR